MFDQSEYYQKHRATISRKRKVRYRRDVSHRDRIRLQAHDYYHRFKKKDTIPDRHVVVVEAGERLYTIGRLSLLIGKGVGTIRQYHRKGVIPDPTHFDTRGWRLYRPDQVALLQMVFRRFAKKELRNLKEVKREIASKWRIEA